MSRSSSQPQPASRGKPAYALRALGREELPNEFYLGATRWRHVHTVKHDFFAATGFYEDDAGNKSVLKVSRRVDFLGVPMEWAGRYLCGREVRFYKKLADVPNVPKLLGTFGKTGFIHAYAEGEPLSKDAPVPDGFFTDLLSLLGELHRLDIAYVDTNKPQNILIGDDGKPHLIDFQISWDVLPCPWSSITRWVLRRLQAADIYHVRKHHRRFRPDELSSEQIAQAKQTGSWIRLHRVVVQPFKKFRRRTIQRLRDTGQLLPEGSK